VLLTEELNESEKERAVKESTKVNAVTFATRIFGRGTDFVVRDKLVINSGGIHIIQTFLSSSKSEEIQIKGRTARQGSRGSYSIVLLDNELKDYTNKDIESLKLMSSIEKYSQLDNDRKFFL